MDREKLVKKVNGYIKENDALLKKYKLCSRVVINFPRRKEIPFLSKIAIKIVIRQGGMLDTEFDESSKK
jgi:hypothetical protein